MLTALQCIATLSCALFTGAAIYITLVEHPGRMGCGTVMQAPLAIVSCLAGAGVWLLAGGMVWLVAALLIGSVVPFTFVAILPTNYALLAPGRDLGSSETRTLLERWGTLHAVRSLLSLIASIVYVGLLVGS